MTAAAPAIRAEGLGKRYRLGGPRGYRTLREALVRVARRPAALLGRGSGPAPEIWALRDVSFEVERGVSFGIIGHNGAGKSTLLKLLSRITEPTAGRALVRGRVRALLEVGTGFHPELTGRENIYLNGAILGMRRAEIARKFDAIVAFAEVDRHLDTPVKHFSSGMYVRLAFAVAAHLEPEILLVDEVLAVGDAAFQRRCLGRMGEVAREGRTVLFVSHNMQAIRSLCAQGIVLRHGGVEYAGPAERCIERYLAGASEDMPASIDTRARPRPAVVADDRTLRIRRVRLGDGETSAVFYTGRPLAVTLDFELSAPVEDLVLGWGVHTSDNQRLFECRTLDERGAIARLDPGVYRLSFRVASNPLLPGLYTLHCGARCARKGLDSLPAVMSLRVDTRERVDSLWLEGRTGLVQVPAEWRGPEPVGADGGE